MTAVLTLVRPLAIGALGQFLPDHTQLGGLGYKALVFKVWSYKPLSLTDLYKQALGIHGPRPDNGLSTYPLPMAI